MRKVTIVWATILCLVAASGCREAPVPKREAPVPEVEEQLNAKPLPQTGGCNNETVEGPCEFLIMQRIKTEQAPGPAGTGLYEVVFHISQGDKTFDLPIGHFRIPDEREADLREYYQKNSPSKCSAYIVRPPCNPSATGAKVDLSPPDFANPERYM